MSIYIKNALESMIKSSSSRFQERNGFFCSHITKESLYGSVVHNKGDFSLLGTGVWKQRMESIRPALTYLRKVSPLEYEEIYNNWVYYRGINLSFDYTLIDILFSKWTLLLHDEDINVDIMISRLEDLLYMIDNYKTLVENKLSEVILNHWRRNFGDYTTMSIGKETKKYNVVGCALPNLKQPIDNDLERPVISCSLLTNENQTTYRDREVGFLYNVLPENLVSMCPTDSYSNYSEVDSHYGSLVIATLNAFDAVYYDTYEHTFWGDVAKILPFEVMNSNKDSYNEIRLLAKEKPIAIFCKDNVVEERMFELQAASFVYELPVLSLGSKLKRIL